MLLHTAPPRFVAFFSANEQSRSCTKLHADSKPIFLAHLSIGNCLACRSFYLPTPAYQRSGYHSLVSSQDPIQRSHPPSHTRLAVASSQEPTISSLPSLRTSTIHAPALALVDPSTRQTNVGELVCLIAPWWYPADARACAVLPAGNCKYGIAWCGWRMRRGWRKCDYYLAYIRFVSFEVLGACGSSVGIIHPRGPGSWSISSVICP